MPKKILGGDGRLPTCTLSKDVLEGFKGGMEGSPPQTPQPSSISPLSPPASTSLDSPPELTIELMIEKYNVPKEDKKIDLTFHFIKFKNEFFRNL